MRLSEIRARAGRVAHQASPAVAGAFISVDEALAVFWGLRPDQGRALANLVAALAVQAHVVRRLDEIRAAAGELLAAARAASAARAGRLDRERCAREALRRHEAETEQRQAEESAAGWKEILAEMDAEAERGWDNVVTVGLIGLDERESWAGIKY